MNKYNLDLQGPYSWWNFDNHESVFTFLHNNKIISGIYLMTFENEGKQFVLYVGESRRINIRLQEHFSRYLSGLYSIYDADKLTQIQREKIYHWQYNNLTYPDYFMDNYPELSKKIIDMVRMMKIFIARLNENKDILRTIEALIVSHLRRVSDQTDKFLENGSVATQLVPLEVQINLPVEIVGLPNILAS